MEGLMFRFGTNSEHDRHLVGFISCKPGSGSACRNALVLIPGLTEGFMSMSYTEHLSEELLKCDYSTVQVNLSSSFLQFGISSLKRDCEELSKLIGVLQEKYKFQKIALLGHSTGAQDVLYFLRYGAKADCVSYAILQAGVSDREDMEGHELMLEEAQELKRAGKPSQILSERLEGAPITAERFLSLAGRLTDDDMFSTDLTTAELEPILSPVKIPIFLCFSAEDQYVPNKAAQRALAQRMVAVLKRSAENQVVEYEYFTGDHGLTQPEYYQPFVSAVCKFLVPS